MEQYDQTSDEPQTKEDTDKATDMPLCLRQQTLDQRHVSKTTTGPHGAESPPGNCTIQLRGPAGDETAQQTVGGHRHASGLRERNGQTSAPQLPAGTGGRGQRQTSPSLHTTHRQHTPPNDASVSIRGWQYSNVSNITAHRQRTRPERP